MNKILVSGEIYGS
ncbi:hypothetical protein F383_04431 [Gossypium arboreum]|uniref:Uncharacterized protein n=1 Tax=Gossypium arboreum TaxID=29729 RepID=A0A0B0PL33_GOSAR|nr:hypothetical protein F383_04431 [Gossypium arboreum]